MSFNKFKRSVTLSEAFMLLHFSKCMVYFIPFKYIVKYLGTQDEESPLYHEREREVNNIAKLINRACRKTLVKNNCYNRALTARFMLGRRKMPYTFYLGVAKKSTELNAHAWVRSGGVVVTGESESNLYTVISYFSN